LSGYCRDCDWQEDTLVGSSSTGAVRADYARLPAPVPGRAPDWAAINSIKAEPPRSISEVAPSDSAVTFSWIGGDRVFAIDGQLELYVQPLEGGANSHGFSHLQRLSANALDTRAQLVAIRSCVFGTIGEFGSDLYLFSESGPQIVAEDVGRWRVFPRAKNYASQLHVIKENHLEVLGMALKPGIQERDRLGYSWDSIVVSAGL